MPDRPRDLAQIRFDNALVLFEEFVKATVKHPDAATLRGLEGRFAERLQIQASYWSQIKSRSRQIGERLARRFEKRCGKPSGWLDEAQGARKATADAAPTVPRDADERFIVDLVLSTYRRDPERVRARLLELLSEAIQPASVRPTTVQPPTDIDAQLWSKARAAVAPLKRGRANGTPRR